MYFEKIFEMFIAIINAVAPEMIIVAIMIPRSVRVKGFSISFIATAAPVRVLWTMKRVMKLKPITIVFIPPKSTRKPFFD